MVCVYTVTKDRRNAELTIAFVGAETLERRWLAPRRAVADATGMCPGLQEFIAFDDRRYGCMYVLL
jgi:hypothetical protein